MRNINSIISCLVPAMILPVLAACTGGMDEYGREASGNLVLRAGVDDAAMTRSIAEGKLPDGKGYRFTYPADASGHSALPCVFTGGVGLVAASDGHFLTWADVADSKSYTFCLDNVPSAENGSGEFFGVIFSDEEKGMYAAGKDDAESTNDIVWGSCTVHDRTSVELDFKMTHRMSRLTVNIVSDDGTELAGAIVRLCNVVLLPESFDRMTGEVSIAQVPSYGDIVLRDGSEPWIPEPEAGSDGEAAVRYEYMTDAFVFPPQPLRSGNERPRLQVVIPEGDHEGTYSAALPTSMTVTSDGMTSIQSLSRFSAGQHLVLNVTLLHNDQKPVLEFRPAAVERRDFKGGFSAVAKREGIYDLGQFVKLIEAYNKLAGGTDREKWMRQVDRYGKLEGGKWVFNLFTNLSFNMDGNTELFCDGNFTFRMYGYSVTVSEGGNETVFGENEVEQLVAKLTVS